MDIISYVRFSSIFLMPEHLVSTHRFVGQSHLETPSDGLLAGEVETAASDEDDDVAPRIHLRMPILGPVW